MSHDEQVREVVEWLGIDPDSDPGMFIEPLLSFQHTQFSTTTWRWRPGDPVYRSSDFDTPPWTPGGDHA